MLPCLPGTTNPFFPTRKRYQKLYGMFKPEFFDWRLVLILRKAGFAAVAMMFGSSASFQAW